MILKAITYNYVQDNILCNKVVGIFLPDQLKEAINDIKIGFGSDKKLLIDNFDESCDNYFLEFDDEYKSYFYSSDYIIGELDL